jgi:hypothetical protein
MHQPVEEFRYEVRHNLLHSVALQVPVAHQVVVELVDPLRSSDDPEAAEPVDPMHSLDDPEAAELVELLADGAGRHYELPDGLLHLGPSQGGQSRGAPVQIGARLVAERFDSTPLREMPDVERAQRDFEPVLAQGPGERVHLARRLLARQPLLVASRQPLFQLGVQPLAQSRPLLRRNPQQLVPWSWGLRLFWRLPFWPEHQSQTGRRHLPTSLPQLLTLRPS